MSNQQIQNELLGKVHKIREICMAENEDFQSSDACVQLTNVITCISADRLTDARRLILQYMNRFPEDCEEIAESFVKQVFTITGVPTPDVAPAPQPEPAPTADEEPPERPDAESVLDGLPVDKSPEPAPASEPEPKPKKSARKK